MKRVFISILFLIIAAAMLIFVNKILIKESNRIKEFETANALVVDYVDCELDEGDIGVSEILEYTVDNRKYQIQSNTCSTSGKMQGTKVKIKYNPSNPSDAVVASANIFGLIINNLTAVAMIVASIYVLVNKKEDKLASEINDALKALRDDGTLSKLNVKWFKSDLMKILK